MKLMVITSSFMCGVVIDDKTKLVTSVDHWCKDFAGKTEQEVREKCTENRWAVQTVPD